MNIHTAYYPTRSDQLIHPVEAETLTAAAATRVESRHWAYPEVTPLAALFEVITEERMEFLDHARNGSGPQLELWAMPDGRRVVVELSPTPRFRADAAVWAV